MTTRHMIWRLILYRPWLYLAAFLLWSCTTLLGMAPGFFMKIFFDILTNESPLRIGVWALAALVIAQVFAHIALLLAGAITDILHRFSISTLLHRNLLSQILSFPGAQAIPCSPGEAISYFRDDVETAEEGFSWLVDQTAVLISAVVAIVVMVGINARMAALVLLPLFTVVTVARVVNGRVERNRRRSRQGTERVTGALGEILAGIQAIQIANAESSVSDYFRRLSDERQKRVVKDSITTRLLEALYSNTATLAMGIMLVLAAEMMRVSRFSVGDFALYVYLTQTLTRFTAHVGNFIANYKRTQVSFDRLKSLLQRSSVEALVQHHPVYLRGELPKIPYSEKTGKDTLHRLEVRGLSFSYRELSDEQRGSHGIQDMYFELNRGDFVVVTGRTGSGKTTLLRTLLGLLPKDDGDILWNGELVSDPASFFVPPRSAYTAQVPLLFSESVKDNIVMGLPDERIDLQQAIQSAVLEEDIAAMRSGTDTIIGPKGVKVSGGQRQRIAAARMFVRDTELLVFDDLSSALDVDTEKRLWERLFELKHVTCLVVSHRKPAFQRATSIIVLKDGRMVAQGSLESLRESSGEMKRIWYGDLAPPVGG